MITIQALTARGNNARGDAVLDYLLDTERLTAYYLGEAGMEEQTLRWRGKGAAALGLDGEPTREQMQQLARGFAPDGTALCRNAGAEAQRTVKRDEGGDGDGGHEGLDIAVEAGGDAAPVLEAAEHAFDDIALAVYRTPPARAALRG